MYYCPICEKWFAAHEKEAFQEHMEIESKACRLRKLMINMDFTIYDGHPYSSDGKYHYVDIGVTGTELIRFVTNLLHERTGAYFYYFANYEIYEEVQELLDFHFGDYQKNEFPFEEILIECTYNAWSIPSNFAFDNNGYLEKVVYNLSDDEEEHEAILLQIEALLEELTPAELASLSVVIAEKVAENF